MLTASTHIDLVPYLKEKIAVIPTKIDAHRSIPNQVKIAVLINVKNMPTKAPALARSLFGFSLIIELHLGHSIRSTIKDKAVKANYK